MKTLNKRKGVNKECKVCSETFYVEPYRIKTAFFCSIPCHNKDLNNKRIGTKLSQETKDKIGKANSLPKVTKICKGCEVQFKVKHHHSFRKYCTKTCSMNNKPVWNKGKRLSPEHVAKLSGENANNWQGGKSTANQIVRHSADIRYWRIAVFERDDYTCQLCEERGGNLNADHIKPFALYPELRFDLDNGRTLCLECHKKTDTYGNKARYYNKTT